MPYLIDTWIDPGRAEIRAKVRPQHLAYLAGTATILLAAGAKLADDGSAGTGSFYLVELETRREAEAYLSADPYAQAGLIESVTFTRVRKGFFNHQQVASTGTGSP